MIYYVILFLSLTVGGLGVWVRQRSMSRGTIMIVVGIVGAIACVAWQFGHTVLQPAARGPDRGQAVVGYFLANRVLAEVADRQGSIVLFFPPESVLEAEAVGTYAGTFSRVLRGFPDLKVEVLTLAAPVKAARMGQFTLAAFQRACSNTPAAVAYVSFAGVPADIHQFQPAPPERGGGFYVFDPWGTTNWLGALRAGHVRFAVIPRPGIQAAGGRISGEPNEVFNGLYLQATPGTADEIAARLGVK